MIKLDWFLSEKTYRITYKKSINKMRHKKWLANQAGPSPDTRPLKILPTAIVLDFLNFCLKHSVISVLGWDLKCNREVELSDKGLLGEISRVTHRGLSKIPNFLNKLISWISSTENFELKIGLKHKIFLSLTLILLSWMSWELKELIYIPLRFRKAGRMLCGGAR